MRSGVVVDDTHEHLAHDQRADRSEPLTVLPRLGLLEVNAATLQDLLRRVVTTAQKRDEAIAGGGLERLG